MDASGTKREDGPWGAWADRVEFRAGGWLLRPWRNDEADRSVLLRAFADECYRRWNSVNAPTADERGVARFLERVDEGRRAGTRSSWAICAPGGVRVLGGIDLGLDPCAGAGRVAYWLLPQARRRGVATDALRAATHGAFTERGLRRVKLGHASGNERSCRVASRAGFRPEGTKRRAMVATDGRTTHDVHLHVRLVTDPTPDG